MNTYRDDILQHQLKPEFYVSLSLASSFITGLFVTPFLIIILPRIITRWQRHVVIQTTKTINIESNKEIKSQTHQ
jgi:hypothetical protein